MKKLLEGRVVKLGEREYRVTKVSNKILPCIHACDLKDCSNNEDFSLLKRIMNAKTCSDLIDVNACFKLIES